MGKAKKPSEVTVVVPVDKICPRCRRNDGVELNAILNTNRVNWYFMACTNCGERSADSNIEEIALALWDPSIENVPSAIHNLAFDLCRRLPTRTLHDIVTYINESIAADSGEPEAVSCKDTRSLVTCISTWLQAYFADLCFLD